MKASNVLSLPQLYHAYQKLGGFFDARLRAMDAYLKLDRNMRILDIGCGPGHIVRHLPENVEYIGIDVDEKCIAFARNNFADRGTFILGFFDEELAEKLGPLDVIMMNGVMHHIADGDLLKTLACAKAALRPNGVLFTLDGCYAQGQPRIAKWLLDNDRGEHVRTAPAYRDLLGSTFASVDIHVRDDLATWPYTFAIGVASNAPVMAQAAAA